MPQSGPIKFNVGVFHNFCVLRMDGTKTSLSLLERLREDDAEAWDRLADVFSPLVYTWCRQQSLPAAVIRRMRRRGRNEICNSACRDGAATCGGVGMDELSARDLSARRGIRRAGPNVLGRKRVSVRASRGADRRTARRACA